jgi:diamine N-acetyltransferase
VITEHLVRTLTAMTTHDVRIRRAAPDDAATLAAFGARLFEETFAVQNRAEDVDLYLAATYGPDHQSRELADPAKTYYIAEVAGEMAGYALVRWGASPATVPSPRALEICRFYVDRAFHGAGVSNVLMATCIAEGARLGATAIWLGVWERNARAIRFYEKCGFRDVGSQRFFLGNDAQTDRVMMREP